MSIIIKIIFIGLIGVICSILVKQIKPEFSIFIIVATGILIILSILDYFIEIVNFFSNISEMIGVNNSLLKIIFKILGVGYLIEFANNLCCDSGYTSIASKIEFAGKIIILYLALPILNMFIEIITEIIKLC